MDKNLTKHEAIARKRRRIRKAVSGNGERPRLAVYRSEKHIYGQLIDDERGLTLVAVSSVAKDVRSVVGELPPLDAARTIGEMIGERAIAAGISKAVFDRGGRQYHGRVAAVADGARSKGLQF